MGRWLLLALGFLVAWPAVRAEDPATEPEPGPVIRHLFPDIGSPGDRVFILGKNFAPEDEGNAVRFTPEEGEAVKAEVLRSSPRYIAAKVPDLSAGDYGVTVEVGDATSEPAAFTVVEPGVPTITDIRPDSGPAGRPVRIAGANLGRFGQKVTVNFGDVEAPGRSWGRRVYTRVPAGFEAETEVEVTVTVGEATSDPLPFTVTILPPPAIEAIEPDSGPPGEIVRITGEGLCSYLGHFWRHGGEGAPVVTFGGTEARVIYCRPDRIVAVVPRGLAEGPVDVTVAVGDQVSDPVPFPVTPAPPPVVASLSPDHGTVGTRVRIRGKNLGGRDSEIVVDFGGVAAETAHASWFGRIISTTVPAGVAVGEVAVTVTVDGVEATLAEGVDALTFTVEELPAPEIGEIRPASGPPGRRVIITGKHLGSRHLPPKVFFGDAEAKTVLRPFWGWHHRGAFILAVVPEINAGAVKVRVEVGGVASNEEVDFEVTEAGG